MNLDTQIKEFRDTFYNVKTEVQKRIVGQDQIVEGVLLCLLANGHALIEGIPGLGKTQLIRTLSEALDLSFKPIHFTPDMMPSDITGTTFLVEDDQGRKQFEFQRGPIFAQLILADEINRATPRTQSALLEAMQDRTVTVGRASHSLEEPFCVLATQNPLEMEGTYPLPEAQLDRFLFKLLIEFPEEDEILEILRRTTTDTKISIEKVTNTETLNNMRTLVPQIIIAEHVERYIIQLVRATHPDSENAPEIVKQYVHLGAGIRSIQAITLTAKIQAILDERYNVAFEDIDSVLLPALRHRIILNFEGQGERISPDTIVTEVSNSIPTDIPKTD
ncbi:AAA family ATPase [Candidatus Poribacteria bacterium]|nr:AAA family ATPase [Candidatus Poribacteria bacterium]